MAHHVYMLYSETLDKHYVGFSKYRGKRHRQHVGSQSYGSSRADDWVELRSSSVNAPEDARDLEKKIKARGAKRFLVGQMKVAARDTG